MIWIVRSLTSIIDLFISNSDTLISIIDKMISNVDSIYFNQYLIDFNP